MLDVLEFEVEHVLGVDVALADHAVKLPATAELEPARFLQLKKRVSEQEELQLQVPIEERLITPFSLTQCVV